MDKLCLNLYRCHRCTYEFDHPASLSDNNDCTAESRYYTFFNDQTGEIECNKKQNSPCQMSQCECDRSFIEKLANLWTNSDVNRKKDFVYNKYYWKDFKNTKRMNTFGYKNTCVSTLENPNNNDSCCGRPGERRPFSSVVNSCCDDKVSTIGSCWVQCLNSRQIHGKRLLSLFL